MILEYNARINLPDDLWLPQSQMDSIQKPFKMVPCLLILIVIMTADFGTNSVQAS